MFLGLTVTLSLIAVAALVAGAAHGFGSRHLHSGSLFRRAVQHTLARYGGANRYATDIMLGTYNRPSAAQGGWSLIDRNLRARRAVRLAVR